jgi:hypothetical protein
MAETFAVSGQPLPSWALYEAALEAGRFVVRRAPLGSPYPHPFNGIEILDEWITPIQIHPEIFILV